MPDESSNDTKVQLTIGIKASASRVWSVLTDPAQLGKWMLEEGLDVHSEGAVGGAIVFRGDLHGIDFETRGTIEAFESERVFAYRYWSTLSHPTLPDVPENYAVIRFELEPIESGTGLTITLEKFPDDSTFHHANFYWSVAIERLREFCEDRASSAGR